ncbi:MAG: hydrogenase formation protein HypD [Thermodesulfovibrionales bacterium]|nr:hydrogenase formation protein HypD [Thermodesulfovibrionales bacterium]
MNLLRNPKIAKRLSEDIRLSVMGRTRLMEVCGTHTVAIFKSGLRSLLPPEITLLSGPGCPVCVTAKADVDRAVKIAGQKDVILTTFGDMMRVPGSGTSLGEERAKGRDIRVVYSPSECLGLSAENPEKKVVFFATGFETTSPSVSATLISAMRLKLENFMVFSVHKLVPPALRALLSSAESRIDGFILPGHVSTIIGSRPYGFLASEFRTPSVISGFEPVDILEAICMLLRQIKAGRPDVEIQYKSAVRPGGNPKAVSLLNEVFVPSASEWRGIGVIPESGLKLRPEFSALDAERHFDLSLPSSSPSDDASGCLCGEVLRGISIPTDCPLFGSSCTPEYPVGACMVSAEGSCSAYYNYGGTSG